VAALEEKVKAKKKPKQRLPEKEQESLQKKEKQMSCSKG